MAVQTGVTNPVPELTRVAVVPFFNLSQERVVDGRRFANAYFAELQKIPGFQVLPVGVTEQAIVDAGLAMNKPEDALALARLLNVDLVVLGAVTDYDQYYPPRIGMQVSWYTDKCAQFIPGVPVDIHGRYEVKKLWRNDQKQYRQFHSEVVRGQSPDANHFFNPQSPAVKTEPDRWVMMAEEPDVPTGSDETANPPEAPTGGLSTAVDPSVPGAFPGPVEAARLSSSPEQPTRPPVNEPVADSPALATVPIAHSSNPPMAGGWATPATTATTATLKAPETTEAPLMSVIPPTLDRDPLVPLMSYTRIFDGKDEKVVAALRDYVELSGDLRSGGWEAYLHRSEDFIRFTCHRMLIEMLTLHGGEAEHRFVLLKRKQR